MEPSSPRSVGAFLRLGIEPASLRAVPMAAFQAAGEAPDLAQLAFDHLEQIRQVRIVVLQLLGMLAVWSLSVPVDVVLSAACAVYGVRT